MGWSYCKPAPDQLAELKDFAFVHGRLWKSDLRAQWESGKASPLLQRLRNTHGPKWLKSFRFESTEREQEDELEAIAIQCEGMEVPQEAWPAAERLCARDRRFTLGSARGPDRRFKRMSFYVER